MTEINILDFENADIGRLAIHLDRLHRRRKVMAVNIGSAGAVAAPFYQGSGLFVGYSLINTAGAPSTPLFMDGPFSDGRFLGGRVIPASGLDSFTWGGDPIPFSSGVWFQDLAVTSVYAGSFYIIPDRVT